MTHQEKKRIKVIFIAGTGRCGSTLLDNILEQTPGLFSAGELRYFWDRGLKENWLCSCGAHFRRCPVWAQITEAAYKKIDETQINYYLNIRNKVKNKHLLLTLIRFGKKIIEARIKGYSKELGKLINIIQETQNCKAIVDASKYPSHGLALKLIPEIDLRVIHLIRDPRAVSYSWLQPKFDKSIDRMMTRRGSWRTSLEWLIYNYLIDVTFSRRGSKYMLVRYEEFVRSPKSTMDEIISFIDESKELNPLSNDETIEMNAGHTFSGNPNRFHRGITKITADNRWEKNMRLVDKLISATITFPLAIKYGYISFHSNLCSRP